MVYKEPLSMCQKCVNHIFHIFLFFDNFLFRFLFFFYLYFYLILFNFTEQVKIVNTKKKKKKKIIRRMCVKKKKVDK